MLSTGSTCSTHTEEKYIVTYSWEWDKLPNALGDAGIVMGLYGIDSQSSAFVAKLNSSSVTATYYYTDSTRYKAVNLSAEVSANTISANLDSYKLSDSGDRWVWTKKGYVTMSVSPAVSGSKTFAAVRAAGEYAIAERSSAQLDVSVTVHVLTGDITTALSISQGSSGRIYTCNKRQTIFYNDGSKFVEA